MNLCPVCGHDLDFTPWHNGTQHERACPCCGIHFGQDDLDAERRESIYAKWRLRWISDGKRWWSKNPQPPDFNADEQLERLHV